MFKAPVPFAVKPGQVYPPPPNPPPPDSTKNLLTKIQIHLCMPTCVMSSGFTCKVIFLNFKAILSIQKFFNLTKILDHYMHAGMQISI